MRRIVSLVVAVLTAAVPLIHADPAAAAASHGSFAFHGFATLGTFPCTGWCGGSFNGNVNAEFSGLDGTNAWELVYVEAPASAGFGYRDSGLNCMVGEAEGTVTMNASPNTVFGTYGAGPLPHLIIDADLTARFHWLRVGTSARLTFYDVRFDIWYRPIGTTLSIHRQVFVDGDGEALATFAPIPSLNVPDCFAMSHGVRVDAAVAGSGVMEDVL